MSSGCTLVGSDDLTVSGSRLRRMKRNRLMFVFLDGFFEHLDEGLCTVGYLVLFHRLHVFESHRPAVQRMIEPVVDAFG